jgi:hypothetical protein
MTNWGSSAIGLSSEPQNIEPQNVEVWNRCALSFELIEIDRIPYFDIQYSIFAFLLV